MPLFANEPAPSSEDPYEILGVDPLISDSELTDTWKTLMKAIHPDTAGSETATQNINEAYQFLKKHRVDYDRRFLPFNGHFKKFETRPVPLSIDEEFFYQNLYHSIYSHHTRAQVMEPTAGPLFVFYAMLNLTGYYSYQDWESWQLRAYRELLNKLGLLNSLTKSELAGIMRRDPVEALNVLLENYDNFNIRLSTLKDLFLAYDHFYLTDIEKSQEYLTLIERLKNNERIFDPRFQVIYASALKNLKDWVGEYQVQRKNVRRAHKPQYLRTRKLILGLEPFPKAMVSCMRMLLRMEP